MKEEFIKNIQQISEKIGGKRVIKDSDWLSIFCEIAKQVNEHLREWHCIIETNYDFYTKERWTSITIAKYYPRISNFSVWERHTCKDERTLQVPDVGHQRQELRRKLKKIAKILENGID